MPYGLQVLPSSCRLCCMCCQGAHDGLPTCYAAEDQRQRWSEHELHSIDSDVIAGVDLTTTGANSEPHACHFG
jgi:hypothetical protein